MKKLSLRIDELSVESFDTSSTSLPRGTVEGHATHNTICEWGLVCSEGAVCTQGGNTCDTTCNQDLCDCTGGGPYNTTCNVNATCGAYGSCPYQTCSGPQDHTSCAG